MIWFFSICLGFLPQNINAQFHCRETLKKSNVSVMETESTNAQSIDLKFNSSNHQEVKLSRVQLLITIRLNIRWKFYVHTFYKSCADVCVTKFITFCVTSIRKLKMKGKCSIVPFLAFSEVCWGQRTWVLWFVFSDIVMNVWCYVTRDSCTYNSWGRFRVCQIYLLIVRIVLSLTNIAV